MKSPPETLRDPMSVDQTQNLHFFITEKPRPLVHALIMMGGLCSVPASAGDIGLIFHVKRWTAFRTHLTSSVESGGGDTSVPVTSMKTAVCLSGAPKPSPNVRVHDNVLYRVTS